MAERDVRIEPVQSHHADAVQALASNPEVVATTNLPDPYPDDGAEQWIAYVRPRHEAGDEYAFVVKDGDTVVGVTGLVDVQGGTAELGYWVGRPFWGNGYATEGVRQTIEHAFGDLGLTHLFARPLMSNPPSRRVLEKLGFTEGDREQHELWSEDEPVVRYTLDAADWMS